MRAYIAELGTEVWEFTEESVLSGKGNLRFLEKEKMYFAEDIEMDPVRLANGQHLDPDLYAEGFPNRMALAAKKGWFIFHDGNDGYVGIHANDLEVR
jgi:hypothetical protein